MQRTLFVFVFVWWGCLLGGKGGWWGGVLLVGYLDHLGVPLGFAVVPWVGMAMA